VAYNPLGYPSWAAYQNSDPTFRVYKRFGTLRNRVLLYRQQELAKLEDQLNALDAEDNDKHNYWIRSLRRDTAEVDSKRMELINQEMKILRHRDDFFEIPSYLAQKHLTGALGDYCAKHNFMREDYALELGLSIDCEDKSQVAIGSGKNVSTAGTVKTSFRFQDEPQSYSLTFHLLPNCIHNVILGKPFLKATRTFSVVSHFARRVKSKIMDDIGQHHLLYLGESAPRFQGMINGTSQDALADSGAKVMIIDEDYALSLGLSIKTGKRNETTLRFADNSTANTSGMIYGVSWEFGPGGDGDHHNLNFHVLKNAPASVILSDTFLFGTEAFSRYNRYLVDDDDDDDDEAYFFAVDIDMNGPSYRK
jgi:hypothetical protein